MVLELTDKNFEDNVINSQKVAVVDFGAIWCGSCKMIDPIIEEIAESYTDSVIVGKMDVDDNPQTMAKFGIRSLPTVLFFENGKIIDKQIGAVPKSILIRKLEKVL